MDFQQFKQEYQTIEPEEVAISNQDEPLVSICLQTYQHAGFIKDCLNGILMQETNFPFEVLIGEDGSTDGTREICMEYVEKYPEKIKLFLHHRENNIKINGHPTGRFNFVYNLFKARGRYIALIDGDDYWTDPQKLQMQVDFLNQDRSSKICFTGNSYLTPKNEFYKRPAKNIIARGDFSDLLKENYIVNSTVVFRNEISKEGLPSFLMNTFTGDWPLHLWLLKDGGKLSFLNIDTTVYRLNVGISKQWKDKTCLILKSRLLMKNMLLDHNGFRNYSDGIKINLKKEHLSLMSYYAKRRQIFSSIFHMFKAMSSLNFLTTLKVYVYSIKLGLWSNFELTFEKIKKRFIS
tara:strand:+ start:1182 stop:2228 length:1047 start_codon:yes stop_codon:yes gene_type:complete